MATPPRVRFAPSPTGYLHIGGARTALFNWLEARRDHGRFVLRIEDTDRERSTAESVQAILDGLRWLGLEWDEGPGVGGPYAPYFQTERLASYRAAADRLIAEKKAYLCYCTKEELEERRQVFERQKRPYKYEGTCRDRTTPVPGRTAVVRFRMPDRDETLSFDDRVIGKISKQTSDLDDFVMLRADGIPLYNFGAVVDDQAMDITLVIRGQEHINSTFPQLLVYRALGWEPPAFAHLPLILGPDREKLSKRRHPEADVMLHKRNGILPEALLNFIVRLGWSHGNDEIISREQMVQWFGFDHVGTHLGSLEPGEAALAQPALSQDAARDRRRPAAGAVPGGARGDGGRRPAAPPGGAGAARAEQDAGGDGGAGAALLRPAGDGPEGGGEAPGRGREGDAPPGPRGDRRGESVGWRRASTRCSSHCPSRPGWGSARWPSRSGWR